MDNKTRAEKLDREGKCIVCEVLSDQRTRGLCTTDYNRCLAGIRQIIPANRELFELQLIQNGRLLPSKQGQRVGPEDNVFAQEVLEFLKKAPPTEEQLQQMRTEAQQVAEDALKKPPSEKTPKTRRRKNSR